MVGTCISVAQGPIRGVVLCGKHEWAHADPRQTCVVVLPFGLGAPALHWEAGPRAIALPVVSPVAHPHQYPLRLGWLRGSAGIRPLLLGGRALLPPQRRPASRERLPAPAH